MMISLVIIDFLFYVAVFGVSPGSFSEMDVMCFCWFDAHSMSAQLLSKQAFPGDL